MGDVGVEGLVWDARYEGICGLRNNKTFGG